MVRKKILWLGSNPTDQDRLDLKGEFFDIDTQINASKYRDQVRLEGWNGAALGELQPLLKKHQPSILHFSGHGDKRLKTVLFETSDGKSDDAPLMPLMDLFRLMGKTIRCVVLNACYTEDLAILLSQHIDCVVGMEHDVTDQEAKMFSSRFYREIGDGESIGKAFELAHNFVETNEKTPPKMNSRLGINPNDICLLQIDTSSSEIDKHLQTILRDVETINPHDKKPLCEYYVDPKAVLLNVKNTWNLNDKDIVKDIESNSIQEYPNDVFDAEIMIGEELLQQDNRVSSGKSERWYLIVGASFGIGKTSFAKMLAYRYAKRYLENTSNSKDIYLPILIFLKRGLHNKEQEDLIDILQKICPCNDTIKEGCNKKIVLILDGLDEYTGTLESFMQSLKELRRLGRYEKIRVIITTRLKPGLMQDQNVITDYYLRLLPFTPNQIDKFLKNFETGLTYESISRTFSLSLEEISKPLFLWMLALIVTKIQLKFDEKWTKEMKRALIYILFFYDTVEGKAEAEPNIWNEKKILRNIAALQKIGQINLSIDAVKVQNTDFAPLVEVLKKFGCQTQVDILARIIFCYFRLVPLSNGMTTVDFIHETFKDYLIAEYYIENLLINNNKSNGDDNIHRLNIGIPSPETIEFLDGLLQILKTKNVTNEQFVSTKMTGLLKSFSYADSDEEAIQSLISVAIKGIRKEGIFFRSHAIPREEIWTEGLTNNDRYSCLWLHRWLCLHILINLDANLAQNKNDKDHVRDIIKYTGDFIPPYIKNWKSIDLSQADLRRSNLAEANMAGANLRGADLRGADLRGANLDGANLSLAKLSQANLFRAKISNADLTEADLFRADLSGAIMIESNLSNANLSDVNFSDPVLFRAEIIGSDLCRANLCDADLSFADLSGAKLSYANLAYAKLSYATLTNANLASANLSDADLSNANISEVDFSDTNLSCTLLSDCINYSDVLFLHAANFQQSIKNKQEFEIYKQKSYARNELDNQSGEQLGVFDMSSSGDDGNDCWNVLDNNFETRWSNYGTRSSYVEFDLGEQRTVFTVYIAWFKGNRRKYDFIISVSDDGKKYHPVYEGKSSGMTLSYQRYAFNNSKCRYLRITVNGNSHNNWSSITEVQIYGSGAA